MTSVDPDSARQDTTLDIVVSGSGFSQGSEVSLGQNGVPSAEIRTNSTVFVNSRKLTANITISATADTGKYDVIVAELDGRKGIGVELFALKQKAEAIPVTAAFRDAATDGLLSDGLSTYAATIMPYGNFSLDVRNTNRAICQDFHGQAGAPPASCLVGKGYITTDDASLPGGFPAMGVGTSMTSVSLRYWSDDSYAWFLRYGRDCNQNPVSANRAVVTHPDASTWTIDYPGPAILCRSPLKGRPVTEFVGTYSMPAQITIQLP